MKNIISSALILSAGIVGGIFLRKINAVDEIASEVENRVKEMISSKEDSEKDENSVAEQE